MMLLRTEGMAKMNRATKMHLLRQIQDVFPQMRYGDYSWTLNDTLVLQTIPNYAYREQFGASFRTGSSSPWLGLKILKWRRCLDCPLLDERGWPLETFDRLPQPNLYILEEEPDQWAHVEAACFFRCLARRIEEVVGPLTGKEQIRAAFQDWRREVEVALTPDPCGLMRAA